jgi:hypothetical protein
MKNLDFKRHFIFSSSAATLNYLFQFILLKVLGPKMFADFTSLWGYVSFFLIGGTVGLYFAAMRPISHKVFKSIFLIVSMLSLLFFVLGMIIESTPLLILGIVLSSFVLSLNSGKFLGEKKLKHYALLINLNALLKILLLLAFIYFSLLSANSILLILFASFFVGNLVALGSWTQDPVHLQHEESGGCVSALMMAFLTHALPVFDILWFEFWMNSVPPEYAPLSLVNRSIFFIQLIFAQWILSRGAAIHSSQSIFQWSRMILPLLGCGFFALLFKWCFKLLDLSPISLPIAHTVSTGLLSGILSLGFLVAQEELTQSRFKFPFSFLIIIISSWVGAGLTSASYYQLQWILIPAIVTLLYWRSKQLRSLSN